jgi:hypothetical protein
MVPRRLYPDDTAHIESSLPPVSAFRPSFFNRVGERLLELHPKYVLNGFRYVHNLVCTKVLAVEGGSEGTRKPSANNQESIIGGRIEIFRSKEEDEDMQIEVWRRLSGFRSMSDTFVDYSRAPEDLRTLHTAATDSEMSISLIVQNLLSVVNLIFVLVPAFRPLRDCRLLAEAFLGITNADLSIGLDPFSKSAD